MYILTLCEIEKCKCCLYVFVLNDTSVSWLGFGIYLHTSISLSNYFYLSLSLVVMNSFWLERF